jgi:hypothetical protein
MTRRAYTPSDFCAAYGIGRKKLYAEIKSGKLSARKVGRRTIILMQEAERWEKELPIMGRVVGMKGIEKPND